YHAENSDRWTWLNTLYYLLRKRFTKLPLEMIKQAASNTYPKTEKIHRINWTYFLEMQSDFFIDLIRQLATEDGLIDSFIKIFFAEADLGKVAATNDIITKMDIKIDEVLTNCSKD